MSSSKKNNSWCVPSFDLIPTNKPLVTPIDSTASNLLDTSYKEHRFKRKISETSLSKILEACEPQKSSELAISKQKQNEISDWLQYRASKRQASILVLSGPSGCGKTSAIKLLATEKRFNIIEWITPVDQVELENKYVMRQGDRFEDHLIRATRYRPVFSNYSKQLLLVKDLPNIYYHDHNSFFALLEKYSQVGKEALIFICTDTGSSRFLQTLFAPTVREKFGIDLININPVTSSAMKNALKRVSDILNSVAYDILCVSQQHIDKVLSNNVGDVRSAVLNLLFISLKVAREHLQSECVVREETLDLLHGVGRVINPKREPGSNPCKFVHDPEEIAGFFHSHPVVFVNFLQENYLNTVRSIEEATSMSDILSLTNVLNSEWRDRNLNRVALSYCIRGLMLTNEKPVSAWNPVRKPRDDYSNTRRCLIAAENQCYESIIKPALKKTQEVLNEDIEVIIE